MPRQSWKPYLMSITALVVVQKRRTLGWTAVIFLFLLCRIIFTDTSSFQFSIFVLFSQRVGRIPSAEKTSRRPQCCTSTQQTFCRRRRLGKVIEIIVEVVVIVVIENGPVVYRRTTIIRIQAIFPRLSCCLCPLTLSFPSTLAFGRLSHVLPTHWTDTRIPVARMDPSLPTRLAKDVPTSQQFDFLSIESSQRNSITVYAFHPSAPISS
mmetsp:Transcript_13848/g.22273  ORF Transcript_13848/g.22273 Transcript_13848/m.22273 type:complete len:209 (-) Transcript_13848:988-1614(-)